MGALLDNLLLNQDILNEPYEAITQMRQASPAFYCEKLNGWLVLGHKESSELYKNPNVVAGNLTEHVKNQMRGLDINIVKDYVRIRNKMMLHQDKKSHRRLRLPFTSIFIKKKMAKLTPILVTAINNTIAELKENNDFIEKKSFDFATDFAEPYSTRVIAGLFDIPEQDRKKFQKAGDDVSRFFGMTMGDIEKDARVANEAILFLESYFQRLLIQKLEKPGNDLLSFILKSKKGSDLNGEEIIAQCILIQMAGHYTVIDQLCNTLNIFFQNDLYDYLKDNVHLLPQAIEESIRLDAGVLFMGRMVQEDFSFSGHQFAAGDTLFLGLGAANRDPDVFSNPDSFEIDRDHSKHLGFGHGHHKCLGMELGRLEVKEAFLALFKEFPNLAPSHVNASRKAESLFFRGFYQFPVNI
jgi:cytochrome P450 PksS